MTTLGSISQVWRSESVGAVQVTRPVAARRPMTPTSDVTWESLERLIASAPAQRWVVDVSSEGAVSSACLARIVTIVNRVRDAGGSMVFAGCSPVLASVMKSMRLTRLIPLFPDVASAVADLGA